MITIYGFHFFLHLHNELDYPFMRFIISFPILLILFACSTQRKSNLTTSNEVSELDLSSIEEDSLTNESLSNDSCEFVDKNNWIKFPFEADLKKAVLVEYNAVRRGNPAGELSLQDSLITDRFDKVVALDLEQILKIKQVFQGYENGEYYQNACYEPRHCLYFLDESNRILSYVEFCFECNQYLTSHRDYFRIVCNKQLDTLKYFFQSLGMTKFDVHR